VACLDHLEVHPDEFTHLFNSILINVTSFFRDPEAFEYLHSTIVPKVIEHSAGDDIRICSAGCASGDESYSVDSVRRCVMRILADGND
jgi:two-component system CheB/CheR fusion protein